jgi:Flp pilus assembly protein TadD
MMGRRRRRTVRRSGELTLEGFGEPGEEPVAESGAGGGEEGDYTPSLSAPAGEGEGEGDLPDDPGVVQRSIPSSGETRAEDDGPELATGFSLQEPAGPLSEIPVQDARALPFRHPDHRPDPDSTPGPSPLDDVENARALVGQGRINAALILLRNTVQADPRNVDARVELGVLLDRSGSHAAAVEHLEAALRGAPDNVQILSALGAAQTSLGRFDEAERELKKAQRLAPEDLLVRAHLAIVSFRRGLYALAEAELRWVCERDEGNATAHFYRGEALNRLGRVDEALDAMKTVARLDPGNSRAFYTMGILYDKKHLPTEAAAMYRRARELAPR